MFLNKKRLYHITTWKQFDQKVRTKGCNLIRRLDEFPNSVLVAGCQRSGTTILTRIINQSNEMVHFWFGRDDELAAALILSGYVDHSPQQGRYCFQTTYLDNCLHEYFDHNDYKIIWVLRNPYSVVYSLLYNWNKWKISFLNRHFKNATLNGLFNSCGVTLLEGDKKHRYKRFGLWAISKPLKACLSYNGKLSQVFKLKERISQNRLMIIDYDELVADKHKVLSGIYKFIDIEYKEEYSHMIHSKSVQKASKLSTRERKLIDSLCMPIYIEAKKICLKI